MFKGKPKTEIFSELVNRTAEKLQYWKTKYISKAGLRNFLRIGKFSFIVRHKISREFFWKKFNENKGLLIVS